MARGRSFYTGADGCIVADGVWCIPGHALSQERAFKHSSFLRMTWTPTGVCKKKADFMLRRCSLHFPLPPEIQSCRVPFRSAWHKSVFFPHGLAPPWVKASTLNLGGRECQATGLKANQLFFRKHRNRKLKLQRLMLKYFIAPTVGRWNALLKMMRLQHEKDASLSSVPSYCLRSYSKVQRGSPAGVQESSLSIS